MEETLDHVKPFPALTDVPDVLHLAVSPEIEPLSISPEIEPLPVSSEIDPLPVWVTGGPGSLNGHKALQTTSLNCPIGGSTSQARQSRKGRTA